MKMRAFVAAAALAAVAMVPVASRAGEPPAPGGMPPEMEAMMKLAAPGEHHKHLAHAVGNFNYKMKSWMAPGQPPTETSGTAESHWILGGRFVESVYKGEFMGMAFEGHGLDGYDNGSQKYIGSWVDNMGTMMMTMSGSCEKDGKVRTMTSEFLDPMTGKPAKLRTVLTVKDDNQFGFEMFMVGPDGAEFKNMELVATRR